jgi:hypothetical protein
MDARDRDYFLTRAKEERHAAAHSRGPARSRHEELAAAYQMRVMCIDKGYCDAPPADPVAKPSEPEMIIPAIVPMQA